ncbi:MAG: serine/threonine-protein kinase [Myxococcota bacterium]
MTRSTLGRKIAGLAPESGDVAASLLLAAVRSSLVEETETVRLGRYEVGKRLGDGGMGVVYEGRDPDLDRRVAIKVLRERSEEADGVLQREAQLLAQFSHEHCVTVFDIGADAETGHVWLAMELVDGVNMRHWLGDTKPSRAEIIAAFDAAASALDAMHRAGLSHGDFKPENVLIGETSVKVADFGLARLVGTPTAGDARASAPSGSGSARTVGGGTPGYLAPERLDGTPAAPASDQFAWCVALFEALHHTLPFADDDATREGKIIDPPQRDRMDRVLRQGLQPDPDKRFASMAALRAALGKATQPRWARALAMTGVVVAVGGTVAWAAQPPEPAEVPVAADETPAPAPEVDLAPFDAVAAPIQNHINAAKYDEARAALPELFAVAEAQDSDQMRAMALRIRGTIEQRTSHYDEAIADFERARDLAWSADQASLAIAAAVSLSHVFSEQLGDHERALRELDLAGALLKRRGADPDDNLAFVRARAMATLRSGDRLAAMEQFERAVKLIEVGDADPLARASTLFYVAESGWAVARVRAREAAEEALPVIVGKLGPDHPFAAAFHGVLGKIADAEGDTDAARASFSEALRIYQAANSEPMMLSETHRLLSTVELNADNVAAAKTHMEAARAALDTLGTDDTISHAASDLGFGNIAYAAGDLAEAERRYRSCLRIFEGLVGSEHHDLVPALVHLAEVSRDLKRTDDAVAFAKRALGIIGDAPHELRATAETIATAAPPGG